MNDIVKQIVPAGVVVVVVEHRQGGDSWKVAGTLRLLSLPRLRQWMVSQRRVLGLMERSVSPGMMRLIGLTAANVVFLLNSNQN